MVAVSFVPCDGVDIRMVPEGLRTGTARIFPLGFGRQMVDPVPLPLVDPVEKCLYVISRNILYRTIGVIPIYACIATHHRFPLPLRDRCISPDKMAG
jgi:hypothetical protein